MGRSPAVVEPEIARADDDVEQDDAVGGGVRCDQEVFTFRRALQMCRTAPNVAYKCCSKRCLHALETQQPGWIAQQRGKLQSLTQNRKASARVRMALRVLNGSGPRERFRRKAGSPHCEVYVRAFMEIDAVLYRKNARIASRLQFVSAKFLYGKQLKDARAAAARVAQSSRSNTVSMSPLELMTVARVCCQQDCLGGNLIAGVDAMDYWMKRAANTHTQVAKQVMIREFHCQFPGICRNAVQTVLGVSRDSITKARAEPSELPRHGLLAHYEANPRPLTFKQETLLRFFQTFIAGCPTSHSGLAHINSAIPVNGRKGLWKYFRRLNPLLDVQLSMFMSSLSQYLLKVGFRGLDGAHVDHNVCPACRSFKYEKDSLILQRSMLRDDGECADNPTSTPEARLQHIQQLEERLAEAQEEHARRNRMCRDHVSWWQRQAQFATAATTEYDDVRPVSRASVPRIAMWHCDGEASRQLPHALLETVGGGFLGHMQKNVGFADMVTYECENFFLPDLLHTESVSMLIDMILQRTLRCRGEQVLVLATDCCGSNYNGTLWAFIVYLVDALRWFHAVMILYYMPRHGKGDADKFFGGHKRTWKTSNVISADQLAQYYIDASAGKENVVHVMPHAVCDWKSWLEEKYCSRTAQQIGVQALGFNQVVAVRSSIEQTTLAEDVKARPRPFIANPGWYRARRGDEGVHQYMVFPTAPKPGFVPGKPRCLLPEVEFHVDEAGNVGEPKNTINRGNAVTNGLKNVNFSSFSEERQITLNRRTCELTVATL